MCPSQFTPYPLSCGMFVCKTEFMRGLMILVTNKMELDVAQLLTSDVLFAHFIDETLAFHHELQSVYLYPAPLHSSLRVLIQPEPFHKWKTIEKKCEPNRRYLMSLRENCRINCKFVVLQRMGIGLM